MKVPKRYLLLIAGIVWGAAGFNIARIGIEAYREYISVWNILLSIGVYVAFQMMIFGKLVRKHTIRILGYTQERQYFFKFFDRKAFFIMAFMMTFGIGLRMSPLCPDIFIAVFYTGLGASLFTAGILFLKNFYNTEENHMKKLIHTSFLYAMLGIASGVFYREFTKFNGFTGKTTLAFTHLHMLVLGMLLFLVLALFDLQTDLTEQKKFKPFFVLYNIGLPLMVIMLYVRGIPQVLGLSLSKGADAAISGMAGIAHLILTAGLVFMFLCLGNCRVREHMHT